MTFHRRSTFPIQKTRRPQFDETSSTEEIPVVEPAAVTPFIGLRDLPEDHFQMSDSNMLRVYYLDAYFPKRFAESRTHVSTLRILDLKRGDSDAVRHFADMLAPRIARRQPVPAIVAVPGHEQGTAAANGGLRQVIGRIAGALDVSDCLARTVEIPKSAGAAPGMRRTAKDQIGTMRVCQAERLTGRHVILLDDVITRGETMRAARYLLLKQAKPASVTCLALTRTRSGSDPQAQGPFALPADFSL